LRAGAFKMSAYKNRIVYPGLTEVANVDSNIFNIK